MSRTFQIHPRGFLGAVSGDAQARALSHINTTRLSFGSFQHRTDVVFPHNREVTALYEEYTANQRRHCSFQFYERVLNAALKCFGTTDFYEWLAAQAQADSTDYLHARFLKDTVRFINTGSREMMIDQWANLLSGNREIGNVSVNLPRSEDAFRDMLVYANGVDAATGRDFVEPKYRRVIYIISKWVANPNGITDLLKTMNILFGK